MAPDSCNGCGRVREHVASLLPIKVLEAASDKPLRISGVAMAAGVSRNFNVYTPDELAAFAEKLIGAPVYLEHVDVSTAAGKVTKGTYDPSSRCVLYEAEIYDSAVAEKIRNGLIQHVSVGADYSAIDVVSANVYHGLYNPELSLVAVPGVPETTIQVLEHLSYVPASGAQSLVNLSEVEKLEEKDKKTVEEKVADDLPGEQSPEVEELKEKLAAAQLELEEAKSKLSDAEGARDAVKTELASASGLLEKYRVAVPGVDLLVCAGPFMPVSECLERLGRLELPKMLERLSQGNQVQAQKVRREIYEVNQKYGGS